MTELLKADLFVVVDQIGLGDLAFVEVWHEAKTDNATQWNLHSIDVIKHGYKKHLLYRFPAEIVFGEDDEQQASPFEEFGEKDFIGGDYSRYRLTIRMTTVF
jgi:hypothetical protein